jgi:hypothetical protein
MMRSIDVDNIVRRNFAPDIEKIGASLSNPAALHAIGARIVADYGQEGLRKVMDHIEAIHAEEFSNSEALARIYKAGFCGTVTKGQIAAQRFNEIYRGSSGKRKKTTRAEAIARHTAALVKLLQDEPDDIIKPILADLLERLNWGRLKYKLGQKHEP